MGTCPYLPTTIHSFPVYVVSLYTLCSCATVEDDWCWESRRVLFLSLDCGIRTPQRKKEVKDLGPLHETKKVLPRHYTHARLLARNVRRYDYTTLHEDMRFGPTTIRPSARNLFVCSYLGKIHGCKCGASPCTSTPTKELDSSQKSRSRDGENHSVR